MPNPLIDKVNHILRHKGFDYDQIDEEVFIGTNMCCQLGFDIELITKDVRADISLEEDKIDTPTGVDYFLWLPTPDHQAPSPNKLALGVKTLDFLIRKKRDMKLEEAINYLKSKRPAVHFTKAQIEALKEFKKNL
jgi:hypothetical protein